jgi:hypothetical protein
MKSEKKGYAAPSLPKSNAKEKSAGNLIIITIDGFRWQEIFTGADESLINKYSLHTRYSINENDVLG